MTGRQGWRTTGSGITHRRWECMSRKIRLDLMVVILLFMDMWMILIHGLIYWGLLHGDVVIKHLMIGGIKLQ